MIEHDPPLTPYGVAAWEDALEPNRRLVEDNRILLEHSSRQSSRIAFLEAALETAQAETRHVLKMLDAAQAQVEQALALGKTPADDDFKIVPPDSPYYARAVAPQMRKIEGDAAAKAFQEMIDSQTFASFPGSLSTAKSEPSQGDILSRALRLPNTPDPYGR